MSYIKNTPQLDPALVDLLVCPVTRGPVYYDSKTHRLISTQAGLAFPIRDGIPVMLEEEAIPIDTSNA